MQRHSYHNPRHAEPPGQAGQGAQVFAGVAPAFQREHRLRRQPQLVRDSHPDAAIADIQPEVARMKYVCQLAAPGLQLNASGSRKESRMSFLPCPIQSKDKESHGAFFASLMSDSRIDRNGMASRKRRSRNKRKRSGFAGALLGLLLVVLIASGAAAWLVLTPYGPHTETFVEIAPGSSSAHIGRQLEEAGVVRSWFAFDLLRLWKRGVLEAGEYRFDHPAPAIEVYERIARGDVVTQLLTIPEGENMFEIAARVQEAGFGTRQEFLDAAKNEAGLVSDLDPGAKSLEGYLFPDTYRFSRDTSPAQIAAAMVHHFHVVAGELGLRTNVHEVVTIASLVERETAVSAERPLVASVFENRLAKHMPLMSDPSVIYGLELEGRWRGQIHESDLTYNTPYNTYLHTGLPPGPVANPGINSLRAAMHPARTDYLYFVAAGANAQGRSLFARTLDEHNRNVAKYRHALRKAGEQ